MNKKRVVHVIHWPKSGIVTLVREMLPLFDKSQFDQHVLFFQEDKETMLQFEEISSSVTTLHFDRSLLLGVVGFKKKIKELQPDILHTHSFLPTLLGNIACNKHCLHITTVHNNYPYYYEKNIKSFIKRWVSRKLYCCNNHLIVAVSYDVQQALLLTLDASMGVHVIPNGVRLDKYKKSSDLFKKKQNAWELISVGRLSLQKDYSLLLKAFKLALLEKPFLRLTIIGDGPERENLLSLVKKLGVLGNVEFTGWIDEPWSVMTKKNYLYVCSSEYEGFGLSVAEAMALGLPVVSTNVSGVTSLVKDNETGFLVVPGNAQALACKILQILDNDHLRTKVSRNGQQYVHDHYDIKKTVRQYESLYNSI